MKVFLTGAAGMLAADVVAELMKRKYTVIQTDINQRISEITGLDLTDLKEVHSQIKKNKPDYVFHLAAETNVDLCEQKPDHAFRVNTLGTENVVLACQEEDIPLVHISTAGVFDGKKPEPYTEFDTPRPINIYGESKLQSEIIVRNLLKKYFIVRAGWMVGGWELDKKFVYKIVQQLKEGQTQLKAVNGKFGSPTFTKDFAKNLFPIIETGRYGTYHLANKGTCSRFEIACSIVEFMGLKDKVKVNAVDSSQFPLPAPRANSEKTTNYKLELLGMNTMPSWQDSLKEYIMENKNK